MIKPDEISFLIVMQARCYALGRSGGEAPRAIIASVPHLIHRKRAEAMLKKWVGKGWYEYGTALDTGWLTEAGAQASYETEWNNQQKCK